MLSLFSLKPRMSHTLSSIDPFFSGHTNNFHNDERYLRDLLIPRQEPYPFGEYDDTDPEVIREHFRFSRQANIRLWVASYFGLARREDTTLRNSIMAHPEIGDLKIAIHYETNALLRRRARGNDPNGFSEGEIYYSVEEYVDPSKPLSRPDRFLGVAGDMDWFCENYFSHPNYFHINDRPVIVIYLTRRIDGSGLPKNKLADGTVETWDEYELLSAVQTKMLSARTIPSSPCFNGPMPYLVGDQIFNEYSSRRDDVALDLMDAITGYVLFSCFENFFCKFLYFLFQLCRSSVSTLHQLRRVRSFGSAI